jgi:hypothetical protein
VRHLYSEQTNQQIVPKWETVKNGTKAQHIGVSTFASHQRLEKAALPGRMDRRKTGVNTGDFGCFQQKKIKNTLDSK